MIPQSPPVPPPDDDVPWDQLGRVLAGESSVEDDVTLQRWLAGGPARQELLAELRDLWTVTEPGSPSRDPEQVLAAIRHRDAVFVHDIAARPRSTERVPAPMWRRPRRLLAAAAAGVALLGGWWAMKALRPHPSAAVALGARAAEYRTTRGQRLTLTLADGSTVLLGPESVLRYAAGYGAASRVVEFDGEGYFDVVHDDARPFIVRAGNAVARDVGTRFVVRARHGAAHVEVAVTEGRVALSGVGQVSADPALLAVNDIGRVDAAGHTSVLRNTTLDRYVGWTVGRLVFEGTPMTTVAAELGRWYDADVRLEGTGLGEQQLTATFHNEPLTTVLPMIQASLGLSLRAQGRRYVLSRP